MERSKSRAFASVSEWGTPSGRSSSGSDVSASTLSSTGGALGLGGAQTVLCFAQFWAHFVRKTMLLLKQSSGESALSAVLGDWMNMLNATFLAFSVLGVVVPDGEYFFYDDLKFKDKEWDYCTI